MLSWLENLAQTYPETIAMAAGVVIAIAVTQMLRALWFPETWTVRELWRIIVLLDMLICFAFCFPLWHFLDPDKDKSVFRLIASIGMSLVAPVIHYIVIMGIARKWPWLNAGDTPAQKIPPILERTPPGEGKPKC